ncbi:MAG: cupin domain-containing protein [Candidatus Limnocylindrales bacterium]
MPATRTSIESSPKKIMSNERGVNHLIVDASEGLGLISVQVQEFNVGAAFGTYHYHEGSDNIYVVLSGTINSFVDGESHLLSAGDVIFIPAGAAHRTTNGGDTVARALEIYVPPPGTDTHPAPEPGA